MVIPTVLSMPTAASPTPYSPAKKFALKIIATIVKTGIATDCIPVDNPVIMTVAGPVSPPSAIFWTGFPPV